MKAFRIVCSDPFGQVKIYDPNGKKLEGVTKVEILPIVYGEPVRCRIHTFASLDMKAVKNKDYEKNMVKDKYGNPDISLCKNCWCMTHTLVGNICGKCKKPKHIIDVIGDENIGGESRSLNHE